jgi:hypothetical protein
MDYGNRLFDRMHRMNKGYVNRKLRNRNRNNPKEVILPPERRVVFAKPGFFCYILWPMVQRNKKRPDFGSEKGNLHLFCWSFPGSGHRIFSDVPAMIRDRQSETTENTG